MLYLTSDHHFGHKNLLHLEEARSKWDNIEVMERDMIILWNSVVKDTDTVIHLGDFTFHNFEHTKRIFDMLRGKKYLVMGNHDKGRSVTWFRRIGFVEVYKEPIVIEKDGESTFVLSHEPVERDDIFINYHGHTHSKSLSGSNYINCCVECRDFTPMYSPALDKILRGGDAL